MFLLQSLFLFLFGLLVGSFGTMLGIGGGWLHVPFLMILFGFSPQDAIGTSLGVIFFNTLAGSIAYYHQNKIDMGLAKKLIIASLPGALIGPFIVQDYTTDFFLGFFSIFIMIIAVYLFAKGTHISVLPEKRYNRVVTMPGDNGEAITYSTSMELGFIGTGIIGLVSNLLGIGGGIIHVPFMILFLRIPTHIALGTSHLILCVSSGVASLIYLGYGNVKIDFMMPIAMGAIIGAKLGVDLASRATSKLIRRLVAILLMALGFKMLHHVF